MGKKDKSVSKPASVDVGALQASTDFAVPVEATPKLDTSKWPLLLKNYDKLHVRTGAVPSYRLALGHRARPTRLRSVNPFVCQGPTPYRPLTSGCKNPCLDRLIRKGVAGRGRRNRFPPESRRLVTPSA